MRAAKARARSKKTGNKKNYFFLGKERRALWYLLLTSLLVLENERLLPLARSLARSLFFSGSSVSDFEIALFLARSCTLLLRQASRRGKRRLRLGDSQRCSAPARAPAFRREAATREGESRSKICREKKKSRCLCPSAPLAPFPPRSRVVFPVFQRATRRV